ncbi:MAG TPA: hypothetical protein VNA89_07100 [Gemmatimonadaceae bacterium]|nr:hypothetical protein [Gemmatimonadaceae bacterium]
MALREFSDAAGRSWRVWDITPEKLHPLTRAERYLQGFVEGWLAFESADGRDKLRLTPVPARWADASEGELEALLDQAEQAGLAERSSERRARGGNGPHAAEWATLDDLVRPTEAAPVARTFRYPGGRFWTASEHRIGLRRSRGRAGAEPGTPARRHGEQAVVLRFTSGRRSLDLLAWPRGWQDYSDDALAELLWRAFPRDPRSRARGLKRRRRGDAPAVARAPAAGATANGAALPEAIPASAAAEPATAGGAEAPQPPGDAAAGMPI